MKRILVTGGAGFLGSHVVDSLNVRGYDVVVPRSVDYDLRQQGMAMRLIEGYNPDVIINAAATCAGIGAIQREPGTFFYDNITIGINMMEAARVFGTKKFVQVGTVCSYPKRCPVPFKEEDLWTGRPEETNEPYGVAKKALLTMAQAYRAQYGFNAVYLIPTNLYGPRDNFNPETSHVIPALIKKCLEAKRLGLDTVEVWGSGTVTREFLYVTDCAEAIVAAMGEYNDGAPINIGSGVETSMERLVDSVAVATGYTGRFMLNLSRPDGQSRRRLAVDKAAKAFGFSARTPLGEGLRKTVEWYLQQDQ
jgi:GDP-L-fucose synthase